MSETNPTHDEFLTEWNGFRTIMCSGDKTVDEKFVPWAALLDVFIRCTDTEAVTRTAAMDMLVVEFPLRMGLETGSML